MNADVSFIVALDALHRTSNLHGALGAAIDGDGMKDELAALAGVVRDSLGEVIALIEELRDASQPTVEGGAE